MSEQEQKSKKELSEKELEQAAGGRAIAPRDGSVPTMGDAVPVWFDADGVRHLGERNDVSYAPASGDSEGSSGTQGQPGE